MSAWVTACVELPAVSADGVFSLTSALSLANSMVLILTENGVNVLPGKWIGDFSPLPVQQHRWLELSPASTVGEHILPRASLANLAPLFEACIYHKHNTVSTVNKRCQGLHIVPKRMRARPFMPVFYDSHPTRTSEAGEPWAVTRLHTTSLDVHVIDLLMPSGEMWHPSL